MIKIKNKANSCVLRLGLNKIRDISWWFLSKYVNLSFLLMKAS
jgi:ribosomal protein L30/L7E